MRATQKKSGRRAAAQKSISARLVGHVTLEARTSGEIAACFDGASVGLGTFSAPAAKRAQQLSTGLPLRTLASQRRNIDKEIRLLVRRLAGHGLLEYPLAMLGTGEEQAVIEPQIPDYWPRTRLLRDTDTVVVSRFAYMRRRADEMILESPRAGALFRICNPKIAATLAALATPQKIKRLRRQDGFPGLELLGLLVDCEIFFKTDAADDPGLRATEGDDNFVLWDFHDLLFHARSTEGRHANPLGGVYPYLDIIAPPSALRPRWPGTKFDLRRAAGSSDLSPAAKLLRERHSIRSFDDRQPITLAELSQFLNNTARVQSEGSSPLDVGGDGPALTYTVRPYPSAGGSYELELYLAVDKCEGLLRGFYHYDAGEHALVPIGVRDHDLETLLKSAEFAMDAPSVPHILITIAARFGRISWKYSSIAYALILKDVGVLTQTLYLMATDMGLGGCAIGSANIDLFAKMTGLDFHVEGAVGQFALGRVASGRSAKPESSD